MKILLFIYLYAFVVIVCLPLYLHHENKIKSQNEKRFVWIVEKRYSLDVGDTLKFKFKE